MANDNLHKAKKAKNDEFYTQLKDIENELKHYKSHFKDKVVYLNCDGPDSNFYNFFEQKFKDYKLTKLVTTSYNKGNSEAMKIVLIKDDNEKCGYVKIETKMDYSGDFRDEESLRLLSECDIVVTNPPFSLFREFVDVLIKSGKKFLIIGSMNAITYKETFKLIQDGKLWLGLNMVKEFIKPDGTSQKFGNINWFTNLDHKRRHEEIDLSVRYNVDKQFEKYDNYDAINVDNVKNIPRDYFEPMGVPITFLGKHNPDQFDILGLDDHRLIYPEWRGRGQDINGKPKYRRIIIKRK